MRHRFFFFIIFSLCSFFAFSQESAKKVDEAFQLIFEQENERLYFEWQILDNYYLYDHRFSITADKGVFVGIVEKSKYSAIIDDEFFGKQKIHENRMLIEAKINTNLNDIAGKKITVQYQGCWKGGICYLPQKRSFTLAQFESGTSNNQALKSASFFDTQTITEFVDGSNVSFFSSLLSSHNIWLITALFFLAGLALAFTPCVIPMYPIISSIILGQKKASDTKLKNFSLSLVYVLAMSIAYSLAGMIAGLFGFNFSSYFQQPLILSIIALFFFIFAIALFFNWNFQMPQSIQNFAGILSRKQTGGSYFGVFVMGFLSALIVGPCIAAPIAGALIYIGEQGSPYLGAASLFALSLGMGLPVLIVGTTAGAISFRYTKLLEHIKELFAFLLLLLAISMLDRFIDDQIAFLGYGLVLLMVSIHFGALNFRSLQNRLTKLAKALCFFVFIYSILLIIGGFAGSTDFIRPLSFLTDNKASINSGEQKRGEIDFTIIRAKNNFDAYLNDSIDEKKPAMVYFYADWCISCVSLRNDTFLDKKNLPLLNQMRLIKIDVTKSDENAQELIKHFGVIGPPAIFFFDSENSQLNSLDIHGFIKPSKLFEILTRLHQNQT